MNWARRAISLSCCVCVCLFMYIDRVVFFLFLSFSPRSFVSDVCLQVRYEAATSLLDTSQQQSGNDRKWAACCRHRVTTDCIKQEAPDRPSTPLDDPQPPTTTTTTTAPSAATESDLNESQNQVDNNGSAAKRRKLSESCAVAAVVKRPRSPCPNVDVRQIPLEQNRPPTTGSLLPQINSRSSSSSVPCVAQGPSFFEDPSAYLAQQTVLLQTNLSNTSPPTESSQSVHTPPPPIKESPPPSVQCTNQQQPAVEQDSAGEELLGDLLDCIPDSMEEVLDRQKDVAAAAEAAAQAERAANLIKQAALQEQLKKEQQQQLKLQQQQQKAAAAAAAAAAVRTKPPPLAIRPATPASAARSRAKAAAEASTKSVKSRSPRRTHQQPIQIQSNASKLLQPAQTIQQTIQQQQQFWPAISASNFGPLRTTSFPFTYHSTVCPTTTPIFSTAALRPGNGNLPMTFLTSSGTTNGAVGQPTNHVFTNQSLPVLTTRPALGPSGQLVHVLTAPGPILTTAEPSTVPITLAVGPLSAGPPAGNTQRGLTRTGKKRKSAPQTVASILQQNHHHQATTLTLSSSQSDQPQPQLVYNVQNFQQIQPQPQQTIQTLALMPDGKTYVVVNSQPAPAPPPPLPQQQQANGGHWLLSPRQATTGQLIAPAGQPMNVTNLINGFNGPTATTFVLGGTGGPQVLQLQDGTLVQTTDQSNLLTNYGGLFIRCPPTPTFSPTPVRTLPMPVPIAPGRSPGRSPDSSSVVEGNTNNNNNNIITSTANLNANAATTTTTATTACGEATPPTSSSSSSSSVGTAHPSPVVQSSQIDSCVQEESSNCDPSANSNSKRPDEYNNNNNNIKDQWPNNKPLIDPGCPVPAPVQTTVIQLPIR